MVPSNLTQQQQDAQFSIVFDIQMHYSDAVASLLTFFHSLQLQKVKSAVKGHHFESKEDIQRAVIQALNDIPQAAFQECYSGSTTGKSVCRHKGCTLKVTKL